MKQNKGITLVALVVTIIIILILAGISINTLVGDNGIITKAKQTKQNITLAGEAEAIQLNQLYYELETGEQMTEDEEGNKKDEIIGLLQKQIEELKKQATDLQVQIETITKQCAEKEAVIISLQKQIEEYQKTVENLQSQIAVKDSTIVELQKQLTQKNDTITNLQTQLKTAQDKFNNLQTNYDNLNTEYTHFKSTIATAITNKGISTSGTASAQVMANNINSITGTKVINLGNGTSFNVSNYSGYKNFTIDNFIVGIYSAGVTQTANQEYNQSGRASGFILTKSYNASNGVLTLGGTSQQIYAWYMMNYARATSTQSFTCFAYLIY